MQDRLHQAGLFVFVDLKPENNLLLKVRDTSSQGPDECDYIMYPMIGGI